MDDEARIAPLQEVEKTPNQKPDPIYRPVFNGAYNFQPVTARIPGLLYSPAFITSDEETSLLDQIYTRQWKELGRRRLQNYGGWPHEKGMVAVELPGFLKGVGSKLVDAGVFPKDQPPNHVLVNEYEPGQGIESHFDGPCYAPSVAAVVSLMSDIVMKFTCPSDEGFQVRVMLKRRSCLVLSEDAYLMFKHGIEAIEEDVVLPLSASDNPEHDPRVVLSVDESWTEPRILPRSKRLSLTVRRAKKTLGFKIKLGN